MRCTTRRLVDCVGDFLDRCCRLFEAGRLVLGPARKIVRSLRDFTRSKLDAGRAFFDERDGTFQRRRCGVEVRLQLCELRRNVDIETRFEIAGSEFRKRGA